MSPSSSWSTHVFNCVVCSRWNVLAGAADSEVEQHLLVRQDGLAKTMRGLGLVMAVTSLNGPQPSGNCVNNTGAAASTLIPGLRGREGEIG